MRKVARDILIIGLRNAHAMERQSEELLESQIDRAGNYPVLRARLRKHRDETIEQIDRLEQSLRDLGRSESTFKDIAMSALGSLLAITNASAGDEILKNLFVSNAFENFEIAAYKSLIALAERASVNLGERLQLSLREEEAMAAWLDSHVERITLDYLAQEERAAA